MKPGTAMCSFVYNEGKYAIVGANIDEVTTVGGKLAHER
jgi:hypothetical protein